MADQSRTDWRSRIRVGTSGWHYKDWQPVFYPESLSSDDYLDHYQQYFDTVEINNSFYNLPSGKTLESWAGRVPENFLFAVKASRYLTHMKKLKDPREPLENFMDRMKSLGRTFGPVLFQLPPHWRMNLDRLGSFLELLPDSPAAFEFRDPSWFDPRVYDLLDERNRAFCIYDLDGRLSPIETPGGFVYVRLHGPDGPYKGSYDTQSLAGWAGRLSVWARQGRNVFCYFDNDQSGYAVQNALELRTMFRGEANA